jgi:hypothetical protein
MESKAFEELMVVQSCGTKVTGNAGQRERRNWQLKKFLIFD